MNIVLGNIDYLKHTSSEGEELQGGLREAGWKVVGPGYDGIADVRRLIDTYKPERIFVQDVRDWLPESNISFRKDIGYTNLNAISREQIPAFTVVKDAWGWAKEQSALARDINAAGIACYYRTEMVREVAPWIRRYTLLRIHHSVDGDLILRLLLGTRGQRRPALVSGNLQSCYPIRTAAFQNAETLGLETIPHPGYGNKGMDTPFYLGRLVQYKVHLATASQWGCAFRKIIESVACGMTPITNLPASDVLPEIDGALVRIPPKISLKALKIVINETAARWNEDERLAWAEKAVRYYDWKAAGRRFATTMEETTCAQPALS